MAKKEKKTKAKAKKEETVQPPKPALRDVQTFHDEQGRLHCENGPAMIDTDHQRYYIRGQLHRENGPALEFFQWPEDNLWLLRGVGLNACNTEQNPNLAQRIVEDPNSLTGQEVAAIENLEIKRIAIERMGPGRYLQEMNAKVLDQARNDVEGTEEALLSCEDNIVYFVGACRSAGRVYYIPVDTECKTVAEARAFMSNGSDLKHCVGAS